MIQIEDTNLPGVKLIKPDVFEDFRGQYIETYNEREYREKGIDVQFVQDDISVSSRYVLRGLHGDTVTTKLVSCAYGRFMLAVVNYDKASAHYLQWKTFVLSDKNRHQVLIPPNYANGHLALSETCIFSYKQSTYYNESPQFTLAWNDPGIDIFWPIDNPILSRRDMTAKALDSERPGR